MIAFRGFTAAASLKLEVAPHREAENATLSAVSPPRPH